MLDTRLVSALLAILLVAGCGDDGSTDAADAATDAPNDGTADADADAGESGPIEMRLLLDRGGDFFAQPFPLETRRMGAAGPPDLTDFPNPRSQQLIDDFIDAAGDRDGFSPSGPIWLRFTGPLDDGNFPTEADSVSEDSPVLLVNIDPDSEDRGTFTPLRIAQADAAGDSYRPSRLLSVLPVPGHDLREGTLYALVVRDSIGSGDSARPLVRSDALAGVLDGTGSDAALVDAFAPLRTWLGEASIDPASVVGATVYRTGVPTLHVAKWVKWAGEQPALSPVSPLSRTTVMDEYCAYEGEWQAPQHQNGTPPYTDPGEGVMQVDGGDIPVEQRTEAVPFVVAVPKQVMPAEGFPLLFYVNGTGGLARQILDRGTATGTSPPTPGTGPAQNLARRGIGVSGMAGVLNPERIDPTDSNEGYIMYNFTNPRGMRDNFAQTLMEHAMFRRLVLSLRIDPTTCPGVDASAATDGMVRYDPAKMAVMGQSLGAHLTGMLSSLDDGYLGAILTGAGGSWIEFAFGPTDPVNLGDTAALLVGLPPSESLDEFHPVIAIFDLAVGPADNIHYVAGVHRRLRPGHTARHVLVIEGYDDDNIPELLQRALVSGIGVDLVGPDVGDAQISDAIRLAGGTLLDPPVTENRIAPDGSPLTAGVVRYLPDRPRGGHYVTFQLEPPKHQYGCFLETLFATGTPTIVAGTGGPDDPCD